MSRLARQQRRQKRLDASTERRAAKQSKRLATHGALPEPLASVLEAAKRERRAKYDGWLAGEVMR